MSISWPTVWHYQTSLVYIILYILASEETQQKKSWKSAVENCILWASGGHILVSKTRDNNKNELPK